MIIKFVLIFPKYAGLLASLSCELAKEDYVKNLNTWRDRKFKEIMC